MSKRFPIPFLTFTVALLINIGTVLSIDITQLRFDIIDIKNGLSQNNVSHIYQDSRGFMWFCTDEGLNRYDGYTFTKLEKEPENKNSLISNFTSCIVESAPGTFWIGTEKGMSVYLFESKRFINLNYPAQIKKITVEDSISAWVQTKFSLYKLRLIKDDNKDYSVTIEPMNAYREVIFKDNNKHLLLSGRDNQVYRYNISTKLISKDEISEIWSRITPKRISSVIMDKNNNYWVGTNSGIYKINIKLNTIDSFLLQRIQIPGLGDRITGVTTGKYNNIYISTNQNGLLMYDANRDKFTEYQNDPYNLSSIPDNKLLSLFTDNSGTIWVGTKGSGIAYSSRYKFKFEHFTQEPFKTTWLTYKYILSFAADKEENIWIGTDGGGLFQFKTKDNVFSNWRNNSSSNSLSNDVVQNLLIDSKGNLWAGTLNGVCKLNPSNNTFIRYMLPATNTTNNLSIPAYANIRLLESNTGEIYTIEENNIFRYNNIRNKFENTGFNFKNNNIVPRSIFQDTDSTWWIASASGLLHMDIQKGLLNEDILSSINKKYFNTDQLYVITAEDNDHFWIGSGNSGLFLFNKKKKIIEANYTEKEGLCNNFIYGILKDNNGKLWMSTNRGISVFDPKLKKFRNYDINDGLQSNEFNSGAYYKTSNNELLFGGINGFNIISPDNIPFNQYKPLVNITNIKTDNISYSFSPYSKNPKKASFANQQNNISFEFASSDYANTPKNNYEYKLEGYDKRWTRTYRNYAAYTKLPPGNYIFYVRASNNDGIWSDQPASFSFYIKPLIWQRWWFRILTALLIISLLIYIIRNRIQIARVKQEEKMLLARQKTEFEKQLAEIKLKALVAQMNPHFIFNCMNSIQGMILSDQSMQASTYLTKLSRLVRSVLENSVKTFIPLQDVIENLKLYLELESLRFDQKFNYDFQIENLDTYNVEMPSMLIQPYVENSIWHGLLKKEGEKNIHVRFYGKGNLCICEIEDNGIGRLKAAELNLKKKHQSLGTIITQEMFDTLHKIKDTSYNVEIIDLYDKEHLPAGTKVVISMEIG